MPELSNLQVLVLAIILFSLYIEVIYRIDTFLKSKRTEKKKDERHTDNHRL